MKTGALVTSGVGAGITGVTKVRALWFVIAKAAKTLLRQARRRYGFVFGYGQREEVPPSSTWGSATSE